MKRLEKKQTPRGEVFFQATIDHPRNAPSSPPPLGGMISTALRLSVHEDRVEMRWDFCHSSGHAEMYVDGPTEVVRRPADLVATIAKYAGTDVADEAKTILDDPNALRA